MRFHSKLTLAIVFCSNRCQHLLFSSHARIEIFPNTYKHTNRYLYEGEWRRFLRKFPNSIRTLLIAHDEPLTITKKNLWEIWRVCLQLGVCLQLFRNWAKMQPTLSNANMFGLREFGNLQLRLLLYFYVQMWFCNNNNKILPKFCWLEILGYWT